MKAFVRSLALSFIAITLPSFAASGAEPASECTVRLATSGASEEWQAAVRAVDARVRVLRRETTDCREITIRSTPSGATVELTTVDGKHAIRHIGNVSELAATVDALLVTIPVDEPAAPIPTATVVVTPIYEPSSSAVVEPPGRRFSLVLGLEAGTRIGWPNRFISPALGGFIGLSLDRWEVGIFGRWETSYSSSEAPLPPGVQMSAVVAGVTFGRRFPVSPRLALLLQAHLGGAIVSEEGNEADRVHGATEGESRAGIAFGIAAPYDAPVHLRAMVGFDAAPTRLHESGKHIDATLPDPPKWAITFMLAFESEALL